MNRLTAMITAVGAMLGVILLCSVGSADNTSRCVNRPIVTYPTYSRPVYTPTYAPSYAPTYVAPYYKEPPVLVQPVIIQENLAPAFVFQVIHSYPTLPSSVVTTAPPQPPQVPGPVSAPGGLTGPSAFATPPCTDDKIEAALLRVLNKHGYAGAMPQKEPPLFRPMDPTPPTMQPTNPVGSGPPQTPGLDARAVTYLNNNCASCHSSDKAKGSVVLFDSSGIYQPYRTDGQPFSRKDILDSLKGEGGKAQMPPAAKSDATKKAPAEILALVENWTYGR